MKKLLLSFIFIFPGLFSNAQTNLYQNIKKLLTETHPEIITENRLIAFNTWSLDNAESRECNKSFEKTYGVYEHAHLKGGSKGIIVVAFNKDNLSSDAVITFTKDGITKIISYKFVDLESLDSNIQNAVFDSNGNEIYRNLSAQNVYNSINHLITR